MVMSAEIMAPTEKQVMAAREEYDAAMREWRLRQVNVNNSDSGADIWVLERVTSPRWDLGADYANEIAAYKFEGRNAREQAKSFLHDKAIRAALEAAFRA